MIQKSKGSNVFRVSNDKVIVYIGYRNQNGEMVMISTRGTYAIRLMIDIAEHQEDGFVPMKEVAVRQGLSLKYLEQFLPALTKNNFLIGIQGKNGGYRLTSNPEEYKIGEILRVTEKSLVPVSCLVEGAPECERRKICKTVDFWSGLNDVVNEYLDSKTLADLM